MSLNRDVFRGISFFAQVCWRARGEPEAHLRLAPALLANSLACSSVLSSTSVSCSHPRVVPCLLLRVLFLVFAIWLLFLAASALRLRALPPEGPGGRDFGKNGRKTLQVPFFGGRFAHPLFFGAVVLGLFVPPPPFVAVYLDFRSPMGAKEDQLRWKEGERARSECQKWL